MKKVNSSSSLQPETISPSEPSLSSSLPSIKEEDINSYLPEDVVTEIFFRLPFETILKARYVSKLWFSLLTNPSFIVRWMRYNAVTLPPWYLFHKLDCPINNSVSILTPDTSSKELLSKLDGFSFRFIPSKPVPPKKGRHNIYLVASSNGLVLGKTKIHYAHRYFVCNPLTKELVLLPVDDTVTVNLEVCHGFFFESSSSSLQTANYKVVRLRETKNWMELIFEIFSSTTSKWKRHIFECPWDVCMTSHGKANVVGSFGVLYCVEICNRIVAYDLFKNDDNRNDTVSRCRLINLPNQTRGYSDNYCLGKSSEGFVVYAEFTEGELNVWKLEDNISTWTWHLVHNIQIKDMLPENGKDRLFGDVFEYEWSVRYLRPLALNLVDQNVVIFGDFGPIYAYNMETRIIKVLSHDYSYTSRPVSTFILAPWPTTLRSPFHR